MKITTQLQGYMTDPINKPLVNGIIIVESVISGLRAKYKLDTYGKYNFVIREGKHYIFASKSESDPEYKLGEVNVTANDFRKVYTIEELINKWL